MTQQKNYLKFSQKLIIRSRVHAQRRLTATLSPTNQISESKEIVCIHETIVVCAVHTRPSTVQSTAHPTKYARGSYRSHKDAVMLFCPSFTQSERFLHTVSSDFDVLNQQRVVVMTNFIRMLSGNVIVNVFKSDTVFWWTASFRTPHRCSTKWCICQSPKALQ